MAKDIESELQEILAGHRAREEGRRARAATDAQMETTFTQAATECFTRVIGPAFNQMSEVLKSQGVPASVTADALSARIDVPGTGDARLAGYGVASTPGLAAMVDGPRQRIRFERNKSASGPGSGVGDYKPEDIDAQLVKTKVLTLVRELYGS